MSSTVTSTSRLQPGRALFVQPHYDDVALSCGATAAAWSAAGMQPQVLTVFASELVDGMVGRFAAWKHSRWRIEDADTVHALRRAEDQRAAQILGCGIRWLGLPDAIYRGDRYPSDDALYGDLHPDEEGLAEHLATEIANLPEWREGCRIFVPLGVGNHVDHQLVFEAGARLALRGVEVWAYEDLPYGIHTPASLPRRLAKLRGRLGEEVAYPVANFLDRKIEAIGAYGSQLPVIFRFTQDYAAAVRQHALAVNHPAGPVERFWRVAST
ncbi:PIG-L deacetylase family protein [Ramlibacter sp. MMS24-I3-19]|uniref:PIG-L deacetylase family protein n=1 Tax=Ramlibacter sp. MMS24-I3-19 TaxID=3416606 RepID=UPI003D04A698